MSSRTSANRARGETCAHLIGNGAVSSTTELNRGGQQGERRKSAGDGPESHAPGGARSGAKKHVGPLPRRVTYGRNRATAQSITRSTD
ncbi:hypothetical protein ACWCSH_49390, partial [Streptosporangium sp. NPDC001682]